METDDRPMPDKDFKSKILHLEEERDAALKRVADLKRELAERDAHQGAGETLWFIDSMPQLVWAAAPDGKVDFCNRRHEEFEGLARDPDGNWLWETAVHPEDREDTIAAWESALRTGRSYEVEHRLRRADGSFGWYLSRAVPVRDSQGRISRWYGTATDIDDLKRTGLTLGAFFDNAAAGMVEMDQGGRFLRANDKFCRISGYTWEELERMTMAELTHPDDREEADRKFREALAGGETWNYECRIRRADGAVRWIWAQGRTHRDEKGKPVRMYGLVADVTERKTLEENLQKAQETAEEASRAKSEFLANMSHEIRTPMTIFMAALDHLFQIDESPERRPFLEMADHAAQRLRALIDDILDFSRIEARRLDIREEPFDLRACIRHSVEMMELKAREKDLRLEMDISPEIPPLVIGDPDRLGQVLINLMGNAVKFTPEGEVKISARVRGQHMDIAVSDTGIGIPEEKRDLLFQSFSQTDSSFTRRFGGTGLGLAISKGLIELMGGRIGFRSRAEGGSVFFFNLPLKPAVGPALTPSAERVEAAEASFPEARILIADDEPMIRKMVLATLAQRGLRAEIAVTGHEAVRKCEEEKFDVVFMDLQMPEMDGIEATRRIRKAESRNGRKTCIVGLTAHARPEVREKCLAAGMDMVLTKPVRMNDLYSVIDECLDM